MTTLAPPEAVPSRLHPRDFFIAFGVVLPLAAIIAPYRQIHLNHLFIFAMALFGGLWCLKAALGDVEHLLFIFLLYVPFQKVLAGDFGGLMKALNFTNIFIYLLVMGWLMTRMHARPIPRRHAIILECAMALFMAIMTASVFAQAVRESGPIRYEILSDLWRWLTPFVVYYLVISICASTAMVKRILLAVVVTTAVLGLLGVKQFWMDMGGATRHDIEGIRIAVTSGPSNLGALFAYYLPYIAALWLANIGRLSYWWLVFPLVWCMDALRTTFSRGAALGFLSAMALILWKRSKVAFAVLAIAIVFLAQSSNLALSHGLFGRMTGTYSADRPGETIMDKLDKSSRTRLIIWGGAKEMIRDHPLFGVGYGRFQREIGNYRPEVADMDPHNNFIKIAAEMGIPALAAFMLLLAVCFCKAYRLHSRESDPTLKALLLGYCGSVVGLLVANMFGSRLDSAEITTQFWAMTGAVVVLGRFHAERNEREAVAGEAAHVAS